jgi:FkbM family methyltransferase
MTIARTTTEMGTFYYLAEDVFIGDDLLHGVAWEGEVVRRVREYLPSGGPCNVIDVGAHVGTHSIPYAREVRGRGRVYAFEPQAVMADLLRRNVDANECAAEVVVLPFAAGHLNGVRVSLEDVIRDGPNAREPYQYEDGRRFNYGGLQLGAGGAKVTMRTLDSFGFTDVALLKVDAEGAEPLVLWGARELLRRERPVLLFERNQKTVTESMAGMMEIPDYVRDFRVEEFAQELGYDEAVYVESDLLLLVPKARGAERKGPTTRWIEPRGLAEQAKGEVASTR